MVKIRMGFVSNSSSSSYAIMGISLSSTQEHLTEMSYEVLFNEPGLMEKMHSRVTCKGGESDLPEDFEIVDIPTLKQAISEVGLPNCWPDEKFPFEFHHSEYNDCYYIGFDIYSMKQDETRAQFRKRVYDCISMIWNIPLSDVDFIDWVEP